VINFFFSLLQQRDDLLCQQTPGRKRSHFFNSFFLTKLLDDSHSYCYANVKRWTKKFDLFACDKVFCPVNISNTHWCLAVIHVQDKRIQYYDSMGGAGRKWLEGLKRYGHAAIRKRRSRMTLTREAVGQVPAGRAPGQEEGAAGHLGVGACPEPAGYPAAGEWLRLRRLHHHVRLPDQRGPSS
jgi:Ulp1 family protease